MVFDFFDTTSIIPELSQHFSVDSLNFEKTICVFDPIHSSALDIARALNLDLLSDITYSSIVCRHITTCNDNLESVKRSGLLRLDQMLTSSTPLSGFLKRYGIEIDPIEKRITLRDMQITISSYCEPCCIYKYTTGQFSLIKECTCGELHDSIALLHTKLFHDKGEVECYISGDDNDMLDDYNSITNGPEILLTIGSIINSIWKKTNQSFLQDAWSKLPGMKRYILEFTVPLSAIETNTERKSENAFCNDADWYDYAGFSADHYYLGTVPLEFYRNKKLLEVAISSLFRTRHNEYCQILPSYHISPDEIRVHKEMNILDE